MRIDLIMLSDGVDDFFGCQFDRFFLLDQIGKDMFDEGNGEGSGGNPFSFMVCMRA